MPLATFESGATAQPVAVIDRGPEDSDDSPYISLEVTAPRAERDYPHYKQTVYELAGAQDHLAFLAVGGASELSIDDEPLSAVPGEMVTPVISWGYQQPSVIEQRLQRYEAAGVRRILLKPPTHHLEPAQQIAGHVHPYGLASLINLARNSGSYSVGIMVHPEGHTLSHGVDDKDDMQRMAMELQAADFAITQFIFDERVYMRFAQRMRRSGITTDIIPGLLPFKSAYDTAELAGRNKVSFGTPGSLLANLLGVTGQSDALNREQRIANIGTDHPIALGKLLMRQGAPGLHIYTENTATLTLRVLKGLLGPSGKLLTTEE